LTVSLCTLRCDRHEGTIPEDVDSTTGHDLVP